MLEIIRERLESYRPAFHCDEIVENKSVSLLPSNAPLVKSVPVWGTSSERTGREAAVLVPIIHDPIEPKVLLTLRSENLSTHAGEVSFPGGKRDAADTSLLETALRESYEEVGVPQSRVDVIGQLSSLRSKHGLSVTPYVGLLPSDIEIKTNPDELSCAFTVPLSFFAQTPPESAHIKEVRGVRYRVPLFKYRHFKIWGLTATVLVELVNTVFDANISLIEE